VAFLICCCLICCEGGYSLKIVSSIELQHNQLYPPKSSE
jgi:hypothetical protein